MTKIYMFTCLLSALTLVEMEPISVNRRVGTNLSIKCSEWKAWTFVKDNVKYFCRSPCSGNKHIIVKADYQTTKRKNRIEITNSEHGLLVTFYNLQKSDSGKYYCGVEIYGYDALLEVNVKVTDAEPSSPKKDPKPADAAVTTSPSTSSNGPTVSTHVPSTNKTLNTSTPYAFQSQGDGSVPYLIITVIVVSSLMLLLIIVWKKAKKQEKAVSRAHIPQEEVQEDVQYDEIRHEDQQPESSATLEHSADPDSVYASCSFFQQTELAAQGDNVYSNVAYLNPAPSSGVSSGGPSSKSIGTDPQSDSVYSLAQLPNFEN